jgi:hypothetical protein
MSGQVPSASAAFSMIDISPAIVLEGRNTTVSNDQPQVAALLNRLIELQQRQLEIAEAAAKAAGEANRRREAEVEQWQKKNQHLVATCREALGVLEGVQRSFLEQMAEYVLENQESLTDGEFVLSEFVDRFGPRMAHLSGVMGMLSQLVASPQSREE